MGRGLHRVNSILKHRNPRRAVIESIGSTAPVTASAELIMIGVSDASVLSPDVTGELFVVGPGVAARCSMSTLVRMVLVPAAMSLLGQAR